MAERREGERRLALDPAAMPGDGHVVFVGIVRSPWRGRANCPKNMAAARERDRRAFVDIAAPYREGLAGLAAGRHVLLLTWLHMAPRDLIVQKPRHAAGATGVFSLRSPARPNPIGLHVARLVALDQETGRLTLDAIDVLDGTPVIDVKPYFSSTDSVPDAKAGA